jgi:hypothetical protein
MFPSARSVDLRRCLVGVELPWAGRSLWFGMTLDEVRGSVEPYATAYDTFVCKTAWAKEFALDGIRVGVFAGDVDALAGVSASRARDHTDARVAVVLDDIDLFGWPVDEVFEALRDLGRNVRATRTNAWIGGDLRLDWAGPFVDHLCLYG